MGSETGSELNAFIEQWQETPEKNREVFLHFREHLSSKEGVSLEFVSRPHITYSLRAVHAARKKRGLIVLIDVIEDSPRWLSICFYAKKITDPENRGTFVPGGLLGEDAVCFDIEKRDEELIRYLEIRLDEACRNASQE